MRVTFALLLTAVLAACGGNSAGNGPCEGASPDPTCDQACDDLANPCPSGFFCAPDGTCNAECLPRTGGGCEANEYCDADGHCQVRVDADCPDVTLSGERTTPTIQLLIDQSGSMRDPFGDVRRWDAMKQALIGTNGVVTETQSAVIFGASLYTGDGEACPKIASTASRALDNRDAIAALLAAEPDEETPTGDSIDVIVDAFIADPPAAGSPPIILLATDGEPDTCEQPNPQEGQAEAIAAAERAFENGIRLYILGVSSDVGEAHLQDMANAGVGNDPAQSGFNAPFYQANNPAELSAALEQLVGGVLSCELQLDGVINPGQASAGSVTVNGEPQQFGTDWEVVDGDTIRLIGAACDGLLASTAPVVRASFPCGAIID